MTKARDLMHPGCECISEGETLTDAARKMRDLHVGALPVCGSDDRLHGIITDRDIVVQCLADEADPETTTAADLAQGAPIWVDADADTEEVLGLMMTSRIRRLPVIENQRLVGIITEADLARHLDDERLAEFAYAIYTAPPNN